LAWASAIVLVSVYSWRMILSENRSPVFGIMRYNLLEFVAGVSATGRS